MKGKRSRILRSSSWTKGNKNTLQEKVKIILNWLTFNRIKDIQKFLELADYYRQFVKDLAFIARLLYDLVKKKQK